MSRFRFTRNEDKNTRNSLALKDSDVQFITIHKNSDNTPRLAGTAFPSSLMHFSMSNAANIEATAMNNCTR